MILVVDVDRRRILLTNGDGAHLSPPVSHADTTYIRAVHGEPVAQRVRVDPPHQGCAPPVGPGTRDDSGPFAPSRRPEPHPPPDGKWVRPDLNRSRQHPKLVGFLVSGKTGR